MKKVKVNKVSLKVLSSIIVFSSLKAHNETKVEYTNLASLYCFNTGKIEKITGKKRSTLSPKVIRAWKLGNLGFTYTQYCGLAQINPMAIGDEALHNMKDLSLRLTKVSDQILHRQTEELAGVEPSPVPGLLQNETAAAKQFAELAERMKYASSCENKFANQKGLGPLGRTVKEALTKGLGKELLGHNNTFAGACPGYREMTVEQRKNLWVFVMMAMAHYESSCKENVVNRGPFGVASGLLQLHDDNEDRYVSQDPDLSCGKGASKNARQSLQCGLTMLGNSVAKGSPVFDDASHWQVLRNVTKPGTQAYSIRYALAQIPDCKSNPLYLDVNLGSRDLTTKATKEAKVQSKAQKVAFLR